jgi:hypothetical protein
MMAMLRSFMDRPMLVQGMTAAVSDCPKRGRERNAAWTPNIAMRHLI